MKKTFFKKGVREFRENRFKYAALIVVLGLGVSMYSSLNSMIESRKITFDAMYEESKFPDSRPGTGSFDVQFLKQHDRIPQDNFRCHV